MTSPSSQTQPPQTLLENTKNHAEQEAHADAYPEQDEAEGDENLDADFNSSDYSDEKAAERVELPVSEIAAERARAMPLILPTIWPAPPSWRTVFADDQAQQKPIELELGCGRPHFLFGLAKERPQHNIVGIEWKHRWIDAAKRKQKRENITNLCAVHGNAWVLVGALFQPASVSAMYLNFPDPWWKSKHRKRRIISETFAELLASRLQEGGTILIQTDVASLLEEILIRFESAADLYNPYGAGRLCTQKTTTARSHREKKCVATGIPVFRGLLQKRSASAKPVTPISSPASNPASSSNEPNRETAP